MSPAARMRAAAVQLEPVLFSREETTQKICEKVTEAARAGAQIVVFPETVVPYYPYFSFIKPPAAMGADHLLLYEQAVAIPGPTTIAIGKAAQRAGVVVAVGVNERDHGTLYNTQLIFDADGSLALARRKITPTFHERMIWGQGDASGLRAVDTRAGRIGALACWEHYNPLARYALMTDHEQIHVSMFPGSMVGEIFSEQIQVTIRHHALESGCFVINATGTLSAEQVAEIAGTTGLAKALSGGCFTAIVSPEGVLLAPPLTEGEGMVLADLDFALITKRKRMMDSVGHYSRPELLSLLINASPQQKLYQQTPARELDAPRPGAGETPNATLAADPETREPDRATGALA
jgi:nitrilase